jgi:cell division protein FtsB
MRQNMRQFGLAHSIGTGLRLLQNEAQPIEKNRQISGWICLDGFLIRLFFLFVFSVWYLAKLTS